MAAHDEGPTPKDDGPPPIPESDFDTSGGMADETREYRPLNADALAVLDADAFEGVDETREYRPMSVAMIAQRLALKQQLRGLAKLADLPMKPPGEEPAEPVQAALTAASSPPPAGPRVLASSAPPVQADPTLQLAPIGSAFAAALVAPWRKPAVRIRWAVLVSVILAALPAGLLLYPSPAPKPAADGIGEPASVPMPEPAAVRVGGSATPTTTPEPGPNTRAIEEVVTPQVTLSAPRPAHHARGPATPKPAASDTRTVAAAPDAAQTLER
jgi:hypothetical protein